MAVTLATEKSPNLSSTTFKLTFVLLDKLIPTSIAVPHPDVFWYHLNGMSTQKNAPKKALATLFPYIFQAKTK